MLSRRDFLRATLQRSSLIALAPTVPAFLARTARAAMPQKDGRVLVVIQLDGGNDGINTVVPFADDGYAKYRNVLRLAKEQLVPVNSSVGLHPSMGDAGKLLESGRLTIVQGVGYPNPNRSHFESMDIWHTARLNPEDRVGLGWIGRALDASRPAKDGGPASVFVGSGSFPIALRGRRSVASGLTRPEDFILAPEVDTKTLISLPGRKSDLTDFVRRSALDACATSDRMANIARAKDSEARYPATDLGGQLRLMARLLKGGIATRVYYTRHAGYDTHSGQLPTQERLLRELAGAVKAFLDDLASAKLADRVVVLMFSEFGRTVQENGYRAGGLTAGTDHGTAGPVFLAGPQVKSGLVGTPPSLLDLDPKHGDLKVAIDFRQVYATVLEDWLELPAKAALSGTFERLALLRA